MGFQRLWSIATLAIALVACSNNDGGTPASSPVSTGMLVDSPVQGVLYSTRPSGLSGRTGPNGEFQFRPGDIVSFDFKLSPKVSDPPGAFAQPFITPFTIFKRTMVPDMDDEYPVNLSRYLLALDTTPGTEVLTFPENLSVSAPSSFTSPTFEADMAAAGLPLAPRADAIAHLKKQFAIWGSWSTTPTPAEVLVITFKPDGTFHLVDDDNPAVPGGNDGIESGTYLWNAATNSFTYTVTADGDGSGGLSHPGTGPYTFVIDASGNTAVLHLGPTASHELHLTRLTDTGNPLIGGWGTSDGIGAVVVTGVATFSADGTFTTAVDGFPGSPSGMERGTYTYNATTGMLTLTTMVDTNGEDGFNDSASLPAVRSEAVVLRPGLWSALDFLYLRDPSDPSDHAEFYRIKVP